MLALATDSKRPKTAVAVSRKMPGSQNQTFRTGLLRSCDWRTHPAGQLRSFKRSHWTPLQRTLNGLGQPQREEVLRSGNNASKYKLTRRGENAN